MWHTKNKKIIALQTMNSIELSYRDVGLVRVHKSYIVNIQHIKSYGNNVLTVCGESIPIGRTYKKNVMDLLL